MRQEQGAAMEVRFLFDHSLELSLFSFQCDLHDKERRMG